MTPLLLIDDDQELCAELNEILTDQGFAVDMAHNGHTGRELLATNRYDLVLLDLKIPGVDGYELLEYIRQNGLRARVLVLSGRPVYSQLSKHDPNFKDREETVLNNANGFLNKPYDIAKLLMLITKLARR